MHIIIILLDLISKYVCILYRYMYIDYYQHVFLTTSMDEMRILIIWIIFSVFDSVLDYLEIVL